MKRSPLLVQSLALVIFGVSAGSICPAEERSSVHLKDSYDISTTPADGETPAFSAEESAAGTADMVDNNRPAGAFELSQILPNPGDAVVSPGAGSAPVFRIQNPVPAPQVAGTLPSFPVLPALLLLAGIAPALVWLSWTRSRKNVKQKAASPKNPGAAPGPNRNAETGPVPLETMELQTLRREVLAGLKEMRTRTEAFTDALESGLVELQTELIRARRTVVLLREERMKADDRMERGPAMSPDSIEPSVRPYRGETPGVAPEAPAVFRNVDPNLDPAWLLLDDPAPGIVTMAPAPPAAGVAPGPPGAKALRTFTVRPVSEADDFRRALDFTTPAERREMILGLARAGRSIDDIARQVKVGRGEVTLALTRAHEAAPGA